MLQKKQHNWVEKLLQFLILTGYIYDADGIDAAKLAYVMEMKNVNYGRISDYLTKYPNAKYVAGKRPWEVKCDIALPCATQNELNEAEAKALIKNGCICVAEGANMPSTPEAVEVFQKLKSCLHQEKHLMLVVLQLQV
jgi:glutamate dehydrogenase (NADP+)